MGQFLSGQNTTAREGQLFAQSEHSMKRGVRKGPNKQRSRLTEYGIAD
jgi:hypothetical protein